MYNTLEFFHNYSFEGKFSRWSEPLVAIMKEIHLKKNQGTAMKIFLLLITTAVLLFSMSQKQKDKKIDDWDYNETVQTEDKNLLKNSRIMPTGGIVTAPIAKTMSFKAESIGFATGGAKDADNFYDNLKNGYLPKLKSITYEGVFYDHYFDTAKDKEECKELFCPSYSTAVQKSLFLKQNEYYLSVGLNSNIKAKDFARKKLNLVVVLDISGSMSSPFNRYYYDRKSTPTQKEDEHKSKMQIANESLVGMLKHLKNDDSLGIVLFDSRSYLAKPLRDIKSTDIKAIKRHILKLRPKGGTNWSEGYKSGVKLFESLSAKKKDPKEYENRIIFMTDAMPNRGELSEKGLFGMVEGAAKEGIYTSFIGIGIDFNTDLVERVSKIKGANYYSVHSYEDFQKRLDEEFDYMVTPLVFDLKLSLKAKGYEIEAVYGSPEANKATKTLLYVNTLFPSATKEEKSRGSIIIVKLKKTSDAKDLKLIASYKDRTGKSYENVKNVTFKSGLYYDNSAIEKGILLSEYVTLLQNWLIDERRVCNDIVSPPVEIMPFYKTCLSDPLERAEFAHVKTWERKSCPLNVTKMYKTAFGILAQKFEKEIKTLNDKSLQKELNTLKQLMEPKKNDNKTSPKDDWQTRR